MLPQVVLVLILKSWLPVFLFLPSHLDPKRLVPQLRHATGAETLLAGAVSRREQESGVDQGGATHRPFQHHDHLNTRSDLRRVLARRKTRYDTIQGIGLEDGTPPTTRVPFAFCFFPLLLSVTFALHPASSLKALQPKCSAGPI